MDKTKKRVLIIVSVIVLAVAVCGIFAYSRYSRYAFLHSDMRFYFSSGMDYLERKEVYQEEGETKYVLILLQKGFDEEEHVSKDYVLRVGFEEDIDIEIQKLLYDALLTGEAYRSISYEMTLPGSLVDELGFRGGLNFPVLYQHPEIIEEYLKVRSITAY